jgi:hypothetical protein
MTGKKFSLKFKRIKGELELIKTASGELRINLESGLNLLGKAIEWWATLKLTPTFKKLKQQGYSDKTLTISVLENGQYQDIETISQQDFVVIAAYLARYKNTQAVGILTYYASLGISHNPLKIAS